MVMRSPCTGGTAAHGAVDVVAAVEVTPVVTTVVVAAVVEVTPVVPTVVVAAVEVTPVVPTVEVTPVVVAVVEVTSSEVDDNESSDSDDVVCRCWWNWQNTNMTYES